MRICRDLYEAEHARRDGGVALCHVKGHSGDVYNDYADALVQYGKGDSPYSRLRLARTETPEETQRRHSLLRALDLPGFTTPTPAGVRPTNLTVGRVTTQLSVPSMPNAHGFAGQKEIARKTPSLALQFHCQNSFQPLKHQPYHIKLPLTINIRLWEAFVLGVYKGALESFRSMYCRRSSSCATALRRASFSSKLLPTVGIVLPSQFYVDVVMRNKSTHTHTHTYR